MKRNPLASAAKATAALSVALLAGALLPGNAASQDINYYLTNKEPYVVMDDRGPHMMNYVRFTPNADGPVAAPLIINAVEFAWHYRQTGSITMDMTIRIWDDFHPDGAAGTPVASGFLGEYSLRDIETISPGDMDMIFFYKFPLATPIKVPDNDCVVEVSFTQPNNPSALSPFAGLMYCLAAPDVGASTNQVYVDANRDGIITPQENVFVQGSPLNAWLGLYGVPAVKSLTFETNPAGGPASQLLPVQPVVAARGQNGDIYTDFHGPVTVALAKGQGPADAILSGTTTVDAVDGVATFKDLKVDREGTFALEARLRDVPTAASATFTVTVGPFVRADVVRALSIAGGLSLPTVSERTRYDLVTSTPARIDLADSIRIVRKVAGLEPNP